ncbi:MAG: type 12 methyltransferase [Herpetosiphonaceae bacterium]|nr:MAG: type 12 methyltransferase [Herpetosiphonaceae bacterium]
MSFFDPFARYYDVDHQSFEDDLLFYQELARRTGGPILELMCGTGRLAIPLASAGYRVVGLDNAPAMLEQARRNIAEARLGRRITLVEADVRSFSLERSFPLAIVGINSFMHLTTVDDQLAALGCITQHLEPGGLLVLDLLNPLAEDLDSLDGSVVLDRMFKLPDNGKLVQKFVARRADVASQIIEVHMFYDEIEPDGSIRRHAPAAFAMRWLYRYEVEHMLARTGLEIEGLYGSYDLDDYQAGSDRLIVIGRKEGTGGL